MIMLTADLVSRLRHQLKGVGMSRLELSPGDFVEPEVPVSSVRDACDEILHALQDRDPFVKALERSFAQAVVKSVWAGVHVDPMWGVRWIPAEIQAKPERPDALLRRIGSQVVGLVAGELEVPASFPALMVVLSLDVPRAYYCTWQQRLNGIQELWRQWYERELQLRNRRKRKRRRWKQKRRT